MKVKIILTFIGGIFTGIALTIICAFLFAKSAKTDNDDIVIFEQATQEIKAEKFEVIQVLSDDGALATIKDWGDNYMTVVLFLDNGDGFYDDQIIETPDGKCVKQIGTFKYVTRENVRKTVPIVDFFDE